jgi:hypothetical protein
MSCCISFVGLFVGISESGQRVCVLPFFAAVITLHVLPSTASVNLNVFTGYVATSAVGASRASVVDVFLIGLHDVSPSWGYLYS